MQDSAISSGCTIVKDKIRLIEKCEIITYIYLIMQVNKIGNYTADVDLLSS